MFVRWMVLVLLLLPLASSASAPPKFEHKKSTMLSFDLRRKTKHHRHRNTTAVTATPAPTADSDQEEMEFTLRSTSYAYVIELDLGTPPQRLEFLIDTGSSNMAIAGPECQDEMDHKCQIETFYHPEKSNTSVDQHIPIETEYGKGAWSGDIYLDVVAFPGEGPRTTAEFAVIRHEKDFFLRNSINEGILGLAYKTLATDDVQPLYDQLVQDNKVPNVFTLGLCNGMGKIWLDAPEPSAYRGPIHYTSINQETWYSVSMTGIDVAGNSLGFLPPSFSAAIVDSGTTDILLQPEIYAAVIAQLKERGPPVDERFWKSYCVDTDPYQWPYITIYLKDMIGGSFGLTVLGKHYVRKQDEFHCLSIGAKPSGAVLGEVVMEGNVVVFDRANQRIGFAPSNMSHPDVGQCGNPIRVNNTVKGRLHKYCRAPNMPQETCFMGCKPCIEYGGVWCPKGHVVVWINGVRSVLSTKRGFCWPGGLFTLDDTKVQTFLTGHGSAEFQAYCESFVPMYKQCSVEGIWVLLMSGTVFFILCSLFLFVSCRGSIRAKSINNRQNPGNDSKSPTHHKERFPSNR
nr:beta-secretase 2-like [Pocillopora verrucosa]